MKADRGTRGLSIDALVGAVHAGRTRVVDRLEHTLDAIARSARPEAWLHVAEARQLLRRAAELDALDARARATLPLCGVPFAVKDNIDVAGMPTTAGCPSYAYVPERSAPVVRRLLAAGAVCIGKTHMDQFATGLVGTRHPAGPCRNAVVAEYIAGGSSSGSAVVVAGAEVVFALGTDTAGSGRVPAALNGVVGIKPTHGRLSLGGVVPACPSLDCVSVFAARVADAALVASVAEGFDRDDPFSRSAPPRAGGPQASRRWESGPFRFAVPQVLDPDIADEECRALFKQATALLERAGGQRVAVDFGVFEEAATLLYGGPWVAERQAAVGDFLAAHPPAEDPAVDPTVHGLVAGARCWSARDTFDALHRLAALRRRSETVWEQADIVVVPPAPRALRIEEVAAEPVSSSFALGTWNAFVNFYDLCAVAVPTARRSCGVPFGVALCAPAWEDRRATVLAARMLGETVATTELSNRTTAAADLASPRGGS